MSEYIIKPTAGNVDNLKLKLSDYTLIIPPGIRGQLMIKNFKNVTIIGQGATIESTGSYGLVLDNCQNVKLSGIDKSFVINGGSQGVKLVNFTSDVEIEQIEIKNTGFAGIMAKTDPSTNQATWRGNFVLKNLFIHDCYIHHVGGEGLYIGHSFYSAEPQPHALENVRVYNNVIEQTNSDGIQIGCASGGAFIYDNIIDGTGVNPHTSFQSSGIQIGDGTAGIVERNIIRNTGSNGISMFGIGGNIIRNNHIINAGTCGVFVDERSGTKPGEAFLIENNDFAGYKEAGVKFFSEKNVNILKGNRFSSSANYLTVQKGVKVIEYGNSEVKYLGQ